jgi:hypothetical protein
MTWGNFKEDSVSESYKKMKDEELKGKVQEGWDDMLKSVKDKHGPQPNGGSGKKQGTRYGGEKQKEDESDKRKEKNEAYDESTLEQISEDEWYDGSDMLGEAQARSSTSYQFTHTPGDEESEKKLADLKKSVKGTGTGKRVVLQGRLGKNNPNAYKYSKNVHMHTHQRIQKADAAHHDVYVYDKSDTQYDPNTVIAENLSIFSAKEIDMLINEVLSKDTSAGTWISDFTKSDDPRFEGDSKEQRKKRALAAYYAAQKKESIDYDSFLEEEVQGDIVKMNAKTIKHANVKDKDDEKDVMGPNSEGEADFLDKHSVQVTDEPAAAAGNDQTGKSKVSTATGPKGQGAGKYDGKDKTGVKEDTSEDNIAEAKHCGYYSCKESTSKKSYTAFKEKLNKKGC